VSLPVVPVIVAISILLFLQQLGQMVVDKDQMCGAGLGRP
jgi:hypothetical protein